jgi:hypothetical protein
MFRWSHRCFARSTLGDHENMKTMRDCEFSKTRCEVDFCYLAPLFRVLAKVRCEGAILISPSRIVVSQPRIVFSRFRDLAF